MLTIISAIIGFLTSNIPSIVDLIKERNDKNHSIKLLDKEIELAQINKDKEIDKSLIISELENRKSLYTYGNDSTGNIIIDTLRGAVRPILTYLFFVAFIGVKIAAIFMLMRSGYDAPSSINIIWDEETHALFVCVMTFWFGQRSSLKRKK